MSAKRFPWKMGVHKRKRVKRKGASRLGGGLRDQNYVLRGQPRPAMHCDHDDAIDENLYGIALHFGLRNDHLWRFALVLIDQSQGVLRCVKIHDGGLCLALRVHQEGVPTAATGEYVTFPAHKRVITRAAVEIVGIGADVFGGEANK